MQEIQLTGSILKTVSDIDIQKDLEKTEGKSIASLFNEEKNQQEKAQSNEQEQESEEQQEAGKETG